MLRWLNGEPRLSRCQRSRDLIFPRAKTRLYACSDCEDEAHRTGKELGPCPAYWVKPQGQMTLFN